MKSFFSSVKALRSYGFRGFVTVRDLAQGKLADVPKVPGVYVVLRPAKAPAGIRRTNPAYRFKGRDPTLPVAALRSKWPKRALVLYIGKAGKRDGKATLVKRLRSYLRSGQGLPSAHWGGRAIWQVVNADDLLVAWLQTTASGARVIEQKLISEFEREHGSLPFANRAR